MTNDTKNVFNLNAELAGLREIVADFERIADRARVEAAEARRELDKIVDFKIDQLDRLMRRGKYAPEPAQEVDPMDTEAELIAALHGIGSTRLF